MTRVNFENLRIYELSEKLADKVWDAVLRWDSLPRDTVGKQLIRAADSIGANIAEGNGRGSSQDYRRFLESLADRFTKRCIGFVARTNANC